jgi:SPP1 family predicted phage head-tail adaptor
VRNKFVTLERMSLDQDDYGQQVREWRELSKAMADIRPVIGREFFTASGEKAEVTHDVTINFQPIDLVPRDRVRHGERLFDIRFVQNVDERNRVLILRCTEVINTNGG